MKIITWNVNGVRPRQARLEALLERHQPDLVCLQEVKVPDDDFPTEALAARGYESTVFGQRTYNGVAILARQPLAKVRRGFTGDPVPDQARVLAAEVDGMQVINVYVVNGEAIDSPKYEVKLAWLEALLAWLRSDFDPSRPLIVAGDFNIAPESRDVYDPERFAEQVHASTPERERLGALLEWGLDDLLRCQTEEGGIFTWWDYRAGAFHRGWGLRIDLVLGTQPVAERVSGFFMDRDERKPTSGEGKPSDHAPFVIELS